MGAFGSLRDLSGVVHVERRLQPSDRAKRARHEQPHPERRAPAEAHPVDADRAVEHGQFAVDLR